MTLKNGYRKIIKVLFIFIHIFHTTIESFVTNYICKINEAPHYNNVFHKNKNRTILKDKKYPVEKNKKNLINVQPSTVITPGNETNDGIIKKVKLKKKDKKIFKKYKDFLDILPKKTNEYTLMEAIEKIKTLAIHKFVESIDIYLSFNPKKSKMTKNDNIKTFITFPHNLKKKREKKVYVVTNSKLQKIASQSGADVVGEDDLINKIKEKEIRLEKKNNNFIICTNDCIHKLTKVGKEIGRKGLMPNEKCGTLVSEFLLPKHIKLFKFENTYIFKLNKLNTLNINIGDVYMSNDEIRENINHLFEHLENLEFFHFNFKHVKTLYLSSTMGFPFKIKKTSL
ncbi:50S ribosomal protein L1, apicoplast, putative [Plasmodium sp. gorilla clade G2]|uniref:50S ribosomal protein L1, apicoplast, putative n=1 Tax=Plasmodium sp. gorilla clade G2 TaxID=880535 RepID=UPI000D20A9F4|nr:50S ribosomal protein L1, apicoplast, putative [Plasmodium sp. gorilla clade G2]SOV16624.1 50S ribosomal protein L1, apicoplast, putative [Plasmodium sp. gorilla clade G2]